MIRMRPVTEGDREFLFELRRAALGQYIEQTWGWHDIWQRADFDARFNPQTQNVITFNEQPVGMLDIVRAEREIRICDVQILPEFQNRRIGTELIQEILKEAENAKIPVILQVLQINDRAQQFYKRLGFQITGQSAPHMFMTRFPAV